MKSIKLSRADRKKRAQEKIKAYKKQIDEFVTHYAAKTDLSQEEKLSKIMQCIIMLTKKNVQEAELIRKAAGDTQRRIAKLLSDIEEEKLMEKIEKILNAIKLTIGVPDDIIETT